MKISSVTLEDDAVFQCQVSQTSKVRGIRSQSAQLTVIVKPEDPMIKWVETDNNATLSHDQDLTTIISATIGTEIYLKCQALGGKPAAQVCSGFLFFSRQLFQLFQVEFVCVCCLRY